MFRLKDWITDSIYALYGFSRMHLYRIPPKHYLSEVKEGKYPVVIIQGYLNKWGFVKDIADQISLLGHPVYVFPDLGNNLRNIAESSEIIYKLIEKNHLKNVIIVGYSKGGLIGKYLLTKLDEGKRIKGVIAVGTPFHGSHKASRFKFIRSNEFYPDSNLIKDLDLEKNLNNKIITISASFDNMISHEKNASLEGAFENIEVKTTGHHRLIHDTEVKEKIITSIEKLSS